MKNKSIIYIICLSLMILISIGCVSANDSLDNTTGDSDDSSEILRDNYDINMKTIENGTVSGGVDLVDYHDFETHAEFTYNLSNNVTIKSAHLYANVYSGSAQPTYAANAVIKLNNNVLFVEELVCDSGSTDGTTYLINNHTIKVYSDYEMYYNVTNTLKNLGTNSFKFELDTSKVENYSFDGRIKLLALVLVYDDGDSDIIHYWINSGQTFSRTTLNTTFNTEVVENENNEVILRNIILSSGEAIYRFNNEILIGDAISGSYYKYHEWDVSDIFVPNCDSVVNYTAGISAFGPSIKNVLSLLTVKECYANISKIVGEYTSGNGACYAGVNNTITASISVLEEDNYIIELLADDEVVAIIETILTNNITKVSLVDPTIRPINETTVIGGENKEVEYKINVYKDQVLYGSNSTTLPILYNGYLGKDLSYPGGGLEFNFNKLINGDVNVIINGSYLSAAAANGTDIFNLNLPENANFVNGLLYISYNWDKTPLSENGGFPLFNVTFNNINIDNRIVGKYRDQSNLGVYGKYGYGVIIYDVSDLIKNGSNDLVLRKVAGMTAVYPATLITMHNITNSNVLKYISIGDGADLLSFTTGNVAMRSVNSTNMFNINKLNINKALWYVFASGAGENKTDLIFNGKVYSNVWNGTDNKNSQYFTADVSDIINPINNVIFVAKGSTILALQQMMVITVNSKINTNLTGLDIVMNCSADKSYSAILTDSNGVPLVDEDVSILLNGQTLNLKTDENGKVTLSLKNLKVGSYIIKVTYAGSEKYNSSEITNRIVVKSLAKLIGNKNIFMYFTANSYYKVRVIGDNGKPGEGVFVYFKVNGNSYKKSTNKYGWASLKITLKPNKYTITAKHKNLKVSNKITVKPVLTAKNISKKKSKVIKFSAKLVNSVGKAAKGKKITFKFKSKTYKVKTNSKGVATLKIKNLKIGKYKIYTIYGKSNIKNIIKIRK